MDRVGAVCKGVMELAARSMSLWVRRAPPGVPVAPGGRLIGDPYRSVRSHHDVSVGEVVIRVA